MSTSASDNLKMKFDLLILSYVFNFAVTAKTRQERIHQEFFSKENIKQRGSLFFNHVCITMYRKEKGVLNHLRATVRTICQSALLSYLAVIKVLEAKHAY